jgi:hypothetical protein
MFSDANVAGRTGMVTKPGTDSELCDLNGDGVLTGVGGRGAAARAGLTDPAVVETQSSW